MRTMNFARLPAAAAFSCALLSALCFLLLGALPAAAIAADNPYASTITNRNLFSLKAPPDPAANLPVAPPPNIPAVKLAGITTIMGGKRAILRVPRPARPPQPASEISLMLQEGGPKEEGVRVLEINIAAGSVKIENQGTVQTLDIANDAPKSAPAPAGGPGIPVPPQNPASGIPVPRPTPAAAGAGGGITSVSRPVRGASPTGAGPQSGGILGAGPSGIPTRAVAPETPPQLTPEEQIVMMEVERERTKDKVAAGLLPPLPPTPLTPKIQQEQQGETPVPGI